MYDKWVLLFGSFGRSISSLKVARVFFIFLLIYLQKSFNIKVNSVHPDKLPHL